MIPVPYCCLFIPIIMKLETLTSQEFRMCPLIFGSKGQGHNALITENCYWCIIAFPLHLSSWNFTQRLPMSWGCTLLISGSKGPRSQCIDYWKKFMLLCLLQGNCRISTFPLHLSSWNFTHKFSLNRGYGLSVSWSKGQCHNALITENCNWGIIAFSLQSWNFTHRLLTSPRYAHMISW